MADEERGPLLQARIIPLIWKFPRLRSRTWRYLPSSLRRQIVPALLAYGYDQFNRAEVVRTNFTQDFELYQAAELLGTVGTFHGPGALEQTIAELREAFGEVRFRPVSIKPVDDERFVALVRFSGTGRGSGISVDRVIAHVWQVRGGLAARLEVYWDPSEVPRSPVLAAHSR